MAAISIAGTEHVRRKIAAVDAVIVALLRRPHIELSLAQHLAALVLPRVTPAGHRGGPVDKLLNAATMWQADRADVLIAAPNNLVVQDDDRCIQVILCLLTVV